MDVKSLDPEAIRSALANFLKAERRRDLLLSSGKLNLDALALFLGRDRTALSRMRPATVAQLETKFEMRAGELYERALRVQEAARTSDQIDHSKQLEGFYQIIRPHTDDPDRFVLEPMQICRDGSALTVEHYSVRFRDPNFLYAGEAHVHLPRFVFAFLSRHRSAVRGTTYRSIGMQVDLFSDPPGCFAGLILRGSGNDSVVGYRFAAIKLKVHDPSQNQSDRRRLSKPELCTTSALEPPIHRLFEDEAILIGEVSRTNMPKTFALCGKIFRHWIDGDDQKLMGMKLQSMRKSVITRIVLDAMGRSGRDGPDQGWRRITDEDLN